MMSRESRAALKLKREHSFSFTVAYVICGTTKIGGVGGGGGGGAY